MRARAGDRRRPAGQTTASPRASSRTSSAIRRARSRRANSPGSTQGGRDLALYALERAARSDAAGRARRVGEAARPAARGRPAATATRASRTTRRASSIRRPTTGSARPATRRCRDAQRAWRVRAALRAGAWADVLAAIDAMPRAAARRSPAWRYWKARALAAAGRARRGRRRSTRRSPARSNFYGMLAAEALGQRASVPASDAARAVAGGARRVRRARRRAARRQARRARHARRSRSASGSTSCAACPTTRCCSRPTTRAAPGSTTARSTPPSARTARHDFALRYLTPFRDAVRRRGARPRRRRGAAVRHRAPGVALRRRTSCRPPARSGLMQLMPPTARWVAKQLERTDYRPSQIADVATQHAVRRVLFQVLARPARPHAGARGRCV